MQSASSAVQARDRGGWSGGGRTKPSPTKSSATEWVVRIACRSGKATAAEGPAWVVFRTHIATSGQSRQSLLFWSLGQQGMSADIDMSLMPSRRACAAAAGAAKGANVKPTVTKTANATLSNRRRFMARTSHGRRNFGSSPPSHVRNRQPQQGGHRAAKLHESAPYYRVASTTAASVKISAVICPAPSGSWSAIADATTPMTGTAMVPIAATEAGRRARAANQLT
jgi:hypothetical protein